MGIRRRSVVPVGSDHHYIGPARGFADAGFYLNGGPCAAAMDRKIYADQVPGFGPDTYVTEV
jgi:hypothetical protein